MMTFVPGSPPAGYVKVLWVKDPASGSLQAGSLIDPCAF